MIHWHYNNSFFWIRIFGYGFKIKDISIHPLTFSERQGVNKGIQIGKWRIGYLSKYGI